MSPMAVAALTALFVWWFSTGAILWLALRRRLNALALAAGAAPVAALSLVGLARAGDDPSVAGAYLGFLSAIGLWGWIELTFLTGVLTGPNRAPCPPGARGLRRFRAAWAAVAHHELVLGAAMAGLAVMLHDAANLTGLLAFAVLFAARISAKVNVYLGVPHLSHDMMPPRIAHLKTYFHRGRVSAAFPLAITGLTGATVWWAERAVAAPAGSGAETGHALLAALAGLALLEHWLMVIPIRDSALWRWAGQRLESRGAAATDPAE